MIPQVNLYTDALRGPRVALRGRVIAGALALLLVPLLAWGGWLQGRALVLEERRAAAEAELAAAREMLSRRSAELAARRPDPVLAREVAHLRAELEGQRELAALLEGAGGATRGFSAHLAGLGRQSLAGLWLTGIVVADGGRSLSLQGRAREHTLLPRYLAALAAEPVYRGQEFRVFRLARGEPGSAMEFTLGSDCADAAGMALAPCPGRGEG